MSAADGIVAVVIAGGVIAGVGVMVVTVGAVRLRAAGIRGWIRCGSGLLRGELGRRLRTMRWWI